MPKPKFPKIIHVTLEDLPNDEPYLAVHEGGVQGLDKPQEVAVYQLVKVGRVKITKEFIEPQ